MGLLSSNRKPYTKVSVLRPFFLPFFAVILVTDLHHSLIYALQIFGLMSFEQLRFITLNSYF